MSVSAEPQVPIEGFREQFRRAEEEIGKVIVGNDSIVRGVLVALFADGHVLLEGIPGLGKTRLVHTLSDVLRLDFSRIQFTPDLMPGDIVGTHVVHTDEDGGRVLRFQPGPIFGNVILADEVNRASPKTQAALLEAMSDHSVTVGHTSHRLPPPFFVLATQNPIEMEGTYPLPEAQLDRFFVKLKLDYPSEASLHEIVERTTRETQPRVEPVLEREIILALRDTVRAVLVARPVQGYAVRLTLATHPESPRAHDLTRRYLRYGASPRGLQAMILGAKVLALLDGRSHASCEDVRSMTLPALRHRILLNFEGEAERVDPDSILNTILESVPESPE